MARDLHELLRQLTPILNPGCYVYCQIDASTTLPPSAISRFREAEGLTVIVPQADAVKMGLPIRFRAAWITLMVNSDLEAVGLTAAVSQALTEAGISCNVIAAANHDHLFVQYEKAELAMETLQALQARAAEAG
jgi:uncharacterized protein